MIRIAVTTAAYDAICATLPLGSVGYEAEANERACATCGWRARWRTGSARRGGLRRVIRTPFSGSSRWRARATHSLAEQIRAGKL
jgi:hypothetical protein